MNPYRLVTMANQVGDCFATTPDDSDARSGIAAHIRQCWHLQMRRAMFDHIDLHRAEGLNALVLQALLEHRDELT
jgi:formate dehydrogenase subunit delta